MREGILKLVNWFFDTINNKQGKEIMATLAEVLAKQDEQTAYLKSIDGAVEELHDALTALKAEVQQYIDQGITPAAADAIIAKIDEAKLVADKIVTND